MPKTVSPKVTVWSEEGPSSAPRPFDFSTFQSQNSPHYCGYFHGLGTESDPRLTDVYTGLQVFRMWSFPSNLQWAHLGGTTTEEGQLCINEERWICLDQAIIETSTGWGHHTDEPIRVSFCNKLLLLNSENLAYFRLAVKRQTLETNCFTEISF